jgi:hypothetical protein
MVYVKTKIRNLGKFWRALQRTVLVSQYCMVILSVLRPFDIFYVHLVYVVVIWHIFPRFAISHQEKTDNPALRVL